MKIVYWILGAVIGAALGLCACMALAALLSGGNILGEGFFMMLGALVSLPAGAIGGAILAARAAKILSNRSFSGPDRERKRRVALALLVGIPTAFVTMIWVADEAHEPPSDATLLREFARHEATLNTLVEMASADKGLDRVDENWTLPADPQSVGVTPARLAEYRRLLREAGTPRGFQRIPTDNELHFFFWVRGSAISADFAKGFSYQALSPARVVQSLDGMRADSREGFTALPTRTRQLVSVLRLPSGPEREVSWSH